jgi:hypothetical protein
MSKINLLERQGPWALPSFFIFISIARVSMRNTLQQGNKKMILLDSDGLAANFHNGIERYMPWSDFSALNADAQSSFLKEMYLKEPYFFYNLEPIEQFRDIVDFCEKSGERWMICTSAGHDHYSFQLAADSKIAFFEKQFGIAENQIIVTPSSEAKLAYANQHNILVDDYGVICDAFKEAGGHSVKVKANTYNAVDVINRIEECIEAIHLLEVNQYQQLVKARKDFVVAIDSKN